MSETTVLVSNGAVAQAALLKAKGYCRVSNRHDIIARVDRPDWWEFLEREFQQNMPIRTEAETGRWADHYRRVYSQDTQTVVPQVSRLIPSSRRNPTAYVPSADERQEEEVILPIWNSLENLSVVNMQDGEVNQELYSEFVRCRIGDSYVRAYLRKRVGNTHNNDLPDDQKHYALKARFSDRIEFKHVVGIAGSAAFTEMKNYLGGQ